METDSLMVHNLCVPCGCRCRYCLLSWDGKPVGVPWEDGINFARKFIAEAKAVRPEIRYNFSFGYSMEHPHLKEAIRFLREIGSPQAEFLQCDGLNIRDEGECVCFTDMLAGEGVKQLNITFYGLSFYHDCFAGRGGDFEFLLRLLQASVGSGLEVSAGIPLTRENCGQIDELAFLLKSRHCETVRLFIPHEEGRGRAMAPIRLAATDLKKLSGETRRLLNPNVYKTESAWITGDFREEETKRALILSLRKDNFHRLNTVSALSVIEELERLDNSYYAAFPSFSELAQRYGDPQGDKLYGRRDLFYHYRQRYAADHKIDVYDVTDERQSGSRRY